MSGTKVAAIVWNIITANGLSEKVDFIADSRFHRDTDDIRVRGAWRLRV